MYKQNCLTNTELRSLLTANTAVDQSRFVEHLDNCAKCQDQLAVLAGDSSWIEGLQLNQAVPKPPNQTQPAAQETELANVMDRMSARTKTAATAAGKAEGLSFKGLPFTQQLVAGRRFGPYEIHSRLGTGGMSVVFTAHDHVLDRQVAVKFLSAELENSKTARQRFLREAKSAAAVEHDFIVPIYSADEVDGYPFLVMSLIEGQSLQQRIDEPTSLSTEQIARIGIQITKGLEAFHSRGLVHRDLKPSNILLQKPEGRVRITDFGLAKCTDDNQLTKSGTVLGTPNYMSPEQAMGQQVDFRSDIYGLGAVLYACVTGRAPFEGPTSLQILNQLREKQPRSILDLKPETPLWLVKVIEKLMARDPNSRYQTAAEIIDTLSQHSQTTRKSASSSPFPTRPTLIAACTLMMVIGANYLLWPSNTIPTEKSEPDPVLIGAEQTDFRITIKTKGDTERVFSTLREAVTQASSGDTIEIEGDGKHEIESTIETNGKELTIRSMAGSAPVLTISNTEVTSGITSNADLVLEGLTFRVINQNATGLARQPRQTAIHCVSGNLHISNCRFDAINSRSDSLNCITVANTRQCEIRNSEFYAGPLNTALDIGMIPGTDLTVENNLIAAGSAIKIAFPLRQVPATKTNVRLAFNTVSAVSGLLVFLPPPRARPPAKPVPVETQGNIWDVAFVVSLAVQPIKEKQMRPEISQRVLEQMMLWQSVDTRFRVRQAYVGISPPNQKIRMMRNLSTRDEWDALWGQTETSSLQLLTHPRNTGLFTREPSTLGVKDFLPLLSEQPQGWEQRISGTQLDYVGPGSEYTTWILSQTPTQ